MPEDPKAAILRRIASQRKYLKSFKKEKNQNDSLEPAGFDPEGSGYDLETAEKYGIEPDETGHYPSFVPETRMLLKGKKHPTIQKTYEAEENLGNEIYQGDDRRYYTRSLIPVVRQGQDIIEKLKKLKSQPGNVKNEIEAQGFINKEGQEISEKPAADKTKLQEYLSYMETPEFQQTRPKGYFEPTLSGTTQFYEDRKLIRQLLSGEIGEKYEEPGPVENIFQKLVKGSKELGYMINPAVGVALSSAIGYEPEQDKIKRVNELIDSDPQFAEAFNQKYPERVKSTVEQVGEGIAEIVPLIPSFRQGGKATELLFPNLKTATTTGLRGKELIKQIALNVTKSIPAGAITFTGQSALTGQPNITAGVSGASFESVTALTDAVFQSLPPKYRSARYAEPIIKALIGGTSFAGGSYVGNKLLGQEDINVLEEFGKGAGLSLGKDIYNKIISKSLKPGVSREKISAIDRLVLEKPEVPLEEVKPEVRSQKPEVSQEIKEEPSKVDLGEKPKSILEKPAVISAFPSIDFEIKKLKTELEEKGKTFDDRKIVKLKDDLPPEAINQRIALERLYLQNLKLKKGSQFRSQKSEKQTEGTFAIKLNNGKVISDVKASNHTELVEQNKIKPGDVKEVGFISNDKFIQTKDYTDKIKAEEKKSIEKPVPKEVAKKVTSFGLKIDGDKIVTHKINGTNREFVTVSTPDRKITKMIEINKLDEELAKFPKSEGKEITPAKPEDLKKAFEKAKEEVRSQKPEVSEEKKEEAEKKPSRIEVVEKPLPEINTDVESFQGRKSEYSEESVNNIIDAVHSGRFQLWKMDPIRVWKNPETGKLYVLAGHSRYEAFKRLSSNGRKDFETIPTIVVEGTTFEEAQKFAKEESNVLATLETPLERSANYRKMRDEGKTEAEIKKRTKELERQNSAYVYNLSFLNPDGAMNEALKLFEKSTSKQDTKNLETIGDWIGTARANYPELTNSHENEMYKFLVHEDAFSKLRNKTDFVDRVGRIVSNVEFDTSKPLNLTNLAMRSQGRMDYDEKIKDAEKLLNSAKKQRDDKLKDLLAKKASQEDIDRILKKYNDEVLVAQKDLIELKQASPEIDLADQSQQNLFIEEERSDYNSKLNEIQGDIWNRDYLDFSKETKEFFKTRDWKNHLELVIENLEKKKSFDNDTAWQIIAARKELAKVQAKLKGLEAKVNKDVNLKNQIDMFEKERGTKSIPEKTGLAESEEKQTEKRRKVFKLEEYSSKDALYDKATAEMLEKADYSSPKKFAESTNQPEHLKFLFDIADKMGIEIEYKSIEIGGKIFSGAWQARGGKDIVRINKNFFGSDQFISAKLSNRLKSGKERVTYTTVHEILHALQESPKLKEQINFEKDLAPKLKEIAIDVKSYMEKDLEYFKDSPKYKRIRYQLDIALKDPSELVTLGLSDPDFARYLDSIPASGKTAEGGRQTVWTRLKEWIRSLAEAVGLPKSQLDRLTDVLDEVYGEKKVEFEVRGQRSEIRSQKFSEFYDLSESQAEKRSKDLKIDVEGYKNLVKKGGLILENMLQESAQDPANNFKNWSKRILDELRPEAGNELRPNLMKLYQDIRKIHQEELKKLGTMPKASKKPISDKQADRRSELVDKLQKEGLTDDEKKELLRLSPGFNVNRMNEDTVKFLPGMLEDIRRQFDDLRNVRVTLKQLQDASIDFASRVTDQNIMDLRKGETKNGVEALGYKLYASSRVRQAEQYASSLPKDADVELKKAANDNLTQSVFMYAKTRALFTTAAQTVKSADIAEKTEFIELMQKIRDNYKDINPDASFIAGELVEKQKLPGFWDYAQRLFYESILSNPFTDLANVTGNFSMLGTEVASRIMLEPKNAISIIRGMKDGIKAGRALAVEIYRGNQTLDSKFTESFKHFDLIKPNTATKRILRAALPTTRLAMEDAFFREVARGMERNVQVKKLQKETGKSLAEIEGEIKEVLTNPYKEDPLDIRGRMEYVEKYTDYLVLQTEAGPWGRSLQRISNVAETDSPVTKAGKFVTKMIVPFVRIANNIFKVSFNYSPTGYLKLTDKSLTKLERQAFLRRAKAGTLFYGGLASMIAAGLLEITGQGPDDKDEKDVWAKLGYKPNHIFLKMPDGNKVGVSYQNINPFNVMFGFIGNLMDATRYDKTLLADDKTISEKFSKALSGMFQTFTDQSFLQGVSKLYSWIQYGDPTYLEDFFAQPVIPNVVTFPKTLRQYWTGEKPSFKARNLKERILRRMGIDDELLPSVDVSGEQRQSGYERFPFFPAVVNAKEKPLESWLDQNRIQIAIPSENTKIGDAQMTEVQYTDYATEVGRALWKKLNANLESLKGLSLEDAQDKIKEYSDREKKFAKIRIGADFKKYLEEANKRGDQADIEKIKKQMETKGKKKQGGSILQKSLSKGLFKSLSK